MWPITVPLVSATRPSPIIWTGYLRQDEDLALPALDREIKDVQLIES
jgi:hypothetical protein